MEHANNWANLFDPYQSEGREQARALETLTQAILVDAPSVGVAEYPAQWRGLGSGGGNDFRALANVAGGEDPNIRLPACRWLTSKLCGGPRGGWKPIDKPFMNGLMNEALMNYYEQVDPDPRIVQFIKANLNYMWAHEWDAGPRRSNTRQGLDERRRGLPAADLNMLIVNGFGFVYKHTGDAYLSVPRRPGFCGRGRRQLARWLEAIQSAICKLL